MLPDQRLLSPRSPGGLSKHEGAGRKGRETHTQKTDRSSSEDIPTMTVCPGVLLPQWQCVWDLCHVEHWSHCQSNAFQKVLHGGSNSNWCYFSTFIIQSILTKSSQTRPQPLQKSVDPHCYTSLLTSFVHIDLKNKVLWDTSAFSPVLTNNR